MSARREVAIGLGSYALYHVVRRLTLTDRGRSRAQANARRIADVERRLGIDIEADVQRTALRIPGLVYGLNAGYAAGNVALSVGWLIRLYLRHDPSYAMERRAAVLAFCGALPCFALFPAAPPRKLDGFVDTFGGSGTGLDSPFLVRWYNPLAAMPSHHMAFAVVTGLGLARRSPSRAAGCGWRAYPVAVAAVVIATANHFVADVLGGALLGGIARRLAR